jgi:predicted aldo/keto reductase-like oxidoreductase
MYHSFFFRGARVPPPESIHKNKARLGEERRNEVILSTKGSWRDKDSASRNIDDSLKRLQTKHIDLWQFHNPRDPSSLKQLLSPNGAYEAAANAKKEGKILHIGLSTHNTDVALRAVESGFFETVMYPFDFVAREAAEKLVPLCKEKNIGFIAMKPFAGGNIRNASLAMKFLLQYDHVLPLPGIEQVKEIDEITSIVKDSGEIKPQERRLMDEIRGELGKRFCRQCMYCMPCPNGVEIWLLTYMRNLHRLWPREKFVEGRFADAAETAKKCVGCGTCEPKCPYELPIREIIVDNYAFFQKVKSGQIQ